MKKSLLTFGALALIAGAVTLNTGCNTAVKGCTTSTDDNYNPLATEDNGTCDEAGTTGKFVKTNAQMNISGSSSNGTYLVTIAEGSNPYEVILTTNFGLTSGGNPVAAVNFTCDVDQSEAAFTSTTVGGGTASGTITHNAGTGKISITVTLSGFGGGIDGTTTDTEN